MSTDELKRRTMLATEQGKIVEVVEGGDILRSASLTSGGVTKVNCTGLAMSQKSLMFSRCYDIAKSCQLTSLHRTYLLLH